MNGWKGARLGRLGICCVKKNVLWKYTLLWHLFFLLLLVGWVFFVVVIVFLFRLFLSFTSSYQVKLGCLALVWVDCRNSVPCFLFVGCVPFFFFSSFSFVRIYFSPKKFWIFFFSKISHFGICLLGFLRIFFSPYFVIVFSFFVVVLFWRNCFLFKVQFHKRRTSTV